MSRQRNQNQNISVHAVAGTEVVLLGLDATEKAARGLLGFRIWKRTGANGSERPLSGGRDFKGLRSKVPVIQAFLWGDYVVEPNTSYTYRVVPVYGDPAAPTEGSAVEVTITTEDPEGQTHAIYFNRGVAGSQAYSRRFGSYRRWYKDEAQEEDPAQMTFTEYLKPEDVPNRAAYKWLSRGLEEALLGFIGQAKGPDYAIRAAVYELTYRPVVRALVDAMASGADVQVVHHAKRSSTYRLATNGNAVTRVDYAEGCGGSLVYKKREIRKVTTGDNVCRAANETIAATGVPGELVERYKRAFLPRTRAQISHNKFMVLLERGKPVQVWTGSTNFTEGGIFGQSNVGHIIRDEAIARQYLDYWEKLKDDPKKASGKNDPPDAGMRNWTVLHQPDLTGPPPPQSMTAIFSPRLSTAMLAWYAEQMAAAKRSVFFTAAFSVAEQILDKVKRRKPVADGEPFQRYLLLEGISGLMRSRFPVMAKCPQNRIAWGETLRTRKGEKDVFIETLSGLNDHVNYLHTKYLLIDPLSEDPIVITGSANFSENSTVNNDENMVVIRGDTRVADIFLGEFMRLFNHYRARNSQNRLSDEEIKEAQSLVADDSWTQAYFTAGTPQHNERLLFR